MKINKLLDWMKSLPRCTWPNCPTRALKGEDLCGPHLVLAQNIRRKLEAPPTPPKHLKTFIYGDQWNAYYLNK